MDLSRASRLAAAAVALAMAALLVLLQFVLTPEVTAPVPLFLLFTAVWVFGAAMLVWKPAFGAVGTAIYGVVVALEFWSMHGLRRAEDAAVVGGALLAAALSGAALVLRRRG